MRPDPAAPLHSERLDLLPIGPEHAEELAAALADPALHAFTGGSPATADDLRVRYARLAAGSPTPPRPGATGRCGCAPTAASPATSRPPSAPGPPRLAWVVGTPWQGRGLATEAARALLSHLAATGVSTVTAHIHPDHHASAAVARALGLTPTGEQQDGETRWQAEAPRP